MSCPTVVDGRLPPPISRIVTVRALRRPTRSATDPSSSPPSGRTKKPTANPANALSSGTSGSAESLGKICAEKYTARNE